MSRKFSEMNQAKVGLIGLVGTLVLLLVALNVGRVTSLLSNETYTADFSRAGGIRTGDDVRVSGVRVGKVTGIDLKGDAVRITFTLSDVSLGDQTEAAVKSANALGRKFLSLNPGGSGNESNIPMARTVKPYDVTNALGDLTRTTEQLDVNQLAGSFDTLADTFKDTAPELGRTLQGVKGLSQTIASRDSELRALLQRASSVTDVLADRSESIAQILANGNSLMQELEVRQLVIRELLDSTQSAAGAVRVLLNENKEVMAPALRKLSQVSDVLVKNQKNIEFALQELGPYARSVGESVGGGPFYFAYVANLVAPSGVAPIIPDLIRKDE